MGRKGKRRKRPAGRPRPEVVDAEVVETEEQEPEEATDEERAADRRPGLFGGIGVPSPYPSLARTIRGSARPVGGDAVVLAVGFLLVLGLWGLFAGLGRPTGPSEMALFLAHPPMSVLADAFLALNVIPDSFASLAIVIALTGVRSLVLVFLLSRLVPGVGGAPVVLDRMGLLRRSMSMFAVNAAGLGIALSGMLLLSSFLGQTAFVLVAGLSLYFLGMAPIVVVAEDCSAADALRRSFRAARLPGTRHLGLVLIYIVLLLFLGSLRPAGLIPPATPSFVVWFLVLSESFMHLLVLGAFAYRWVAVRDEVPAGPARRARRDERHPRR